jgi:hypothetical protein
MPSSLNPQPYALNSRGIVLVWAVLTLAACASNDPSAQRRQSFGPANNHLSPSAGIGSFQVPSGHATGQDFHPSQPIPRSFKGF